MVNGPVGRWGGGEEGQAISEYVMMLAILTLIGLWIVHGVRGRDGMTNLKGDKGTIKNMSAAAVEKIAKD